MLLVIILIVASAAVAQETVADRPEEVMTLCGNILAQTRMLVCFGQEAKRSQRSRGVQNLEDLALPAPPFDLRSSEGDYLENQLAAYRDPLPLGSPYYKNNALSNYMPWLHRPQASSLKMRTKREGLVEECCYKPCSVNELATYC